MSVEPISSGYPNVMNNAVERVIGVAEAMDELWADPSHPNTWKNCDFIALQIRKLCELVLPGSSIAHVESGHDKFDLKNWHPDKAFRQLQQLNDNPMPIPTTMIDHDSGGRQLQPVSKPLPNQILGGIYGRCGDLLHIPSVDRILKGNVGEFDVERFSNWIRGFHKLLMGHVILLPEIQTIYMCTWSGKAGERVVCNRLFASGPSTFSTDGLSEFDLLTT